MPDDIPLCFATCSIGCPPGPSYPLAARIAAIAAAGFTAIELSFPDLLDFANQEPTLAQPVRRNDYDQLCKAAGNIKHLCDAQGLTILMLQPFANFEGWPDASAERLDAFERARGWIRIMLACGCGMLQVGASDSPAEQIGHDRTRFVADLQELADMLAEHGLRLAYENWCWSTHAPDWRDVWDIVQRIDRPNVGLCLDTFQSAGGEWGDPTTASGIREDGADAESLERVEQAWSKSLADLAATVPSDKIFLLQVSDAYRVQPPLLSELDANGLRPKGQWSAAYRPLPFNGGYLPVAAFARAVLQTGFRGWFSYEVFDGGPQGSGKEYDLDSFAQEAARSHRRLMESV